jgi:hypothetical protein
MKAPVLNPLLTGIATRYLASLPVVGLRLAPVLPTQIHAAQYYVYDTENFANVPTNIARGRSAPFKRLVSKLTDDSFVCKDYGVEEPIDNMDIKIYGSIFAADRSAMERAVRVVALNHEIRVRNMARAITQTASPSVKWNAGTNTTIVADVQAAKNAIQASIGTDPNLMVLPRDVFNALCIAPEIKGFFTGVVVPVVTKAMLETIFQVQIEISNENINTATEGQTATMGGIWSDEAVLAYVNPANDIKALTWARTFNWTAADGSGPAGISTFTYDENQIDSRIVRARQYTDERVVASGAAYYLSNVLS